MEKICIISDSHGIIAHAIPVIDAEKPDMVLHLGDCAADARVIQRAFPELTVYAVSGNDERVQTEPLIRVLSVESVKILMTHGHTFNVKNDSALEQLCDEAIERDVDVVLFGHTHHALTTKKAWMTVMNPGTFGRGNNLTYGVLTIDGKKVGSEIRNVSR